MQNLMSLSASMEPHCTISADARGEEMQFISLKVHFRKQLDKSSAFGHQDDQITYLRRGLFIGWAMIGGWGSN
jgi:hypothetical protein